MRQFVQSVSTYAKGIDPDFIIIPQNGHKILTYYENTSQPATDYINALDGVGREDLFYGYNNDNQATPTSERNDMIKYLDLTVLIN